MHIFIALLIYTSIIGALNIKSFWGEGSITTYKLIKSITFYWFKQIKRYFHIATLFYYYSNTFVAVTFKAETFS